MYLYISWFNYVIKKKLSDILLYHNTHNILCLTLFMIFIIQLIMKTELSENITFK